MSDDENVIGGYNADAGRYATVEAATHAIVHAARAGYPENPGYFILGVAVAVLRRQEQPRAEVIDLFRLCLETTELGLDELDDHEKAALAALVEMPTASEVQSYLDGRRPKPKAD